ncbi:MAG: PAS domain-containing protein [Bacteroidota bacterium]
MKDAVLILDKEGKILQSNTYADKLFNLKHIDQENGINVNSLFNNYEINRDIDFSDLETDYVSDGVKKVLSLSQFGIIHKGIELGKILIARDITARKKAEEALRESEAKFRWLFENVPDGIYLGTPDGKLVNVNDTLVQMFGYKSKEELLSADIANELYVNPSERAFWINKLEANGKLDSIELHLKRKDGTPLVVRENAHLLADEHGTLFYEGTLTDITKLKEAEKALR